MKDTPQRVILYGDSILLAGVRASLGASYGVEVISLEHPMARLAEAISSLHPAAVIVDLGSLPTDFPLALLQQSGLLLIGIDPETHQALVWSGKLAGTAATADLVDVICSGPKTNFEPIQRMKKSFFQQRKENSNETQFPSYPHRPHSTPGIRRQRRQGHG